VNEPSLLVALMFPVSIPNASHIAIRDTLGKLLSWIAVISKAYYSDSVAQKDCVCENDQEQRENYRAVSCKYNGT